MCGAGSSRKVEDVCERAGFFARAAFRSIPTRSVRGNPPHPLTSRAPAARRRYRPFRGVVGAAEAIHASGLTRQRATVSAPVTQVVNRLIRLRSHSTVMRQSKEESLVRFGSLDRRSPLGRFLGLRSARIRCNPGRFISWADRDELREAVQVDQTRCTKASIKVRIGANQPPSRLPRSTRADLLLIAAQD